MMAERRFHLWSLVFFIVLVLWMGGISIAQSQESAADLSGQPVENIQPAQSSAAAVPAFDLQKFLALDPATTKLTGLEKIDILKAGTIYVDDAGQLSAEQVANRYLQKDRPQTQKIMPKGPVWVVLPLYNQSGPEDWVLNFGDRLLGRLGRLQSFSAEDMVSRNRIIALDVTQKTEKDRFLNETGPIAIDFKIREGNAALIVMKINAHPNHPFAFSVILSTVREGPAIFLGVPAQQLLWLIAAFGAGAALLSALYARRLGLVYFPLFLLSLPLGLMIPGPVFGDITYDFARIDILVLGIQAVLLALSGWAVAQSFKTTIGAYIIQGVVAIVGGGCVVLALILAPSAPVIGVMAIVVFSVMASVAFSWSVWPYKNLAAIFLLGSVGIFAGAAVVQTMAVYINHDLPHFLMTMVPMSLVAVVPFVLGVLSTLPSGDGDVLRALSPDPSNKNEGQDQERYNQLLLAKESFDYNNLLKVIEHERKQLAAARTREMVRADEMRKAKDQADEANRAKSAFLAVVSHEIRTPMTGVVGMVKLLEDTTLTKSQHDYVQTIRESGNAMMALLNDILDFEKIESGRMQLEQVDFDLHRLLDGVVTLMGGHSSSKGISLNLDIDFSVPAVVVGDMVRLRQILLNLVGNAIKFTNEGGVTIKVSSTLDPEADGQTRMIHHIYFAVEDTGVGISPANQKNIFTPFSQGDKTIARKFGGSGLGLAISRRLVEAMGSTINIKSKEGMGTTFFFTIHMPEGDRARVVDSSAGIGSSAGGSAKILGQKNGNDQTGMGRSLRILVIEDNNITQHVLQTLIEKENHTVTLAASAENAIGFLEMGEKFDLIFADINLPGLSGLEFTRIVRGMSDGSVRNVPIVALSGDVDDETIDACYKAGMTAHMSKPINPEDFLGVILGVARSGPTVASGPSAPVQAAKSVSVTSIEPPAPAPQAPIPPPDSMGHTESYIYTTLEIDLIETLRESLGVDQLNQLLQGLYQKSEEIIGALQAQEKIDPTFTWTRAHEMKGMCGNFGFQKLSDHARNIEKTAKAGDFETVDRLINEISTVYQQSRLEFDRWIKG